jgi:uncharacterized RDD family membrane protein YckC
MEEAFTPASIAARVAERYSRLPSWRESLAAQMAAQSTLDSQGAAAGAPPPAQLGVPNAPGVSAMGHEPEPQQLAIQHEPVAELHPEASPQPYQPDLLRYSVSSDSLPALRSTPPEAHALATAPSNSSDNLSDPLETAVVEPTRPLPARLITTPRELVAPRKVRPRLAEGPLRDEPGFDALSEAPAVVAGQQPVANSPGGNIGFQASIIEPESSAPVRPVRGPEWHSIHLDTEPPIRERRSFSSSSSMPDQPVLDVASIEDRTMAALVDCALTLCAFLLFSTVFAVSSTNLPHGRIALIGAAAILLTTWLLYQLLFFTLTDATPGMRYAHIALCTFNDENPSRAALRGRIAAMLLSALPLGLGFLWAVFDEDSLGWHDRITRTYQRSYREG